MGKLRNFWYGINSLAIVAIVYLDVAFWSSFGPGSIYQQFPVIFLVFLPISFIVFAFLWTKIPKPE